MIFFVLWGASFFLLASGFYIRSERYKDRFESETSQHRELLIRIKMLESSLSYSDQERDYLKKILAHQAQQPINALMSDKQVAALAQALGSIIGSFRNGVN